MVDSFRRSCSPALIEPLCNAPRVKIASCTGTRAVRCCFGKQSPPCSGHSAVSWQPRTTCASRVAAKWGCASPRGVLIRPRDVVLVESLTYLEAVRVVEECGAKIVAVSLDKQGVNVDEVERMCRAHKVRAIFLTPHHQFPTTVALQPDRRLHLLNLARQFGFAVIEDDYDHEFHFESQPLLPMASYAPERVIYVGSLSKLLLPALRIGYIVAPPKVVNALAQQVMLLDSMGNTLTEGCARPT